MSEKKPILAITMGDPAGIGPEIIMKTLAQKKVYEICNPLVIGNALIFEKIAGILKSTLQLHTIQEVSEAAFEFGRMDIFHVEMPDPGNITYGKIMASAGDVAFRCVVKAIDLAMRNAVDGTVTCPIHKRAIHEAGYPFSGHTEIYAHYTQTANYTMLLADEALKIVHVSTHVSLREACDLVTQERILEVIRLLHRGLKDLGFSIPKIGVAGLNPHAGDNGLFGDEEIREIIPAIDQAKAEGYWVEGPVPPDTLFALAKGGRFDGCVAMYHDQGHIPFKLTGFEWDQKKGAMKSLKGVNITLGLPVIRTSVDHGTAFEIAGKGLASPEALLYAIDYAVKMYENKSN
jgi:4-phospho-D-threonate 3-dehydrogenase / 4-phospho-D-erythronate 3-dehydrogenase